MNGLGNLVIGYNQGRGPGLDNRTGSHNLVVGSKHNYSSYGGIVAGLQGGITTPYSTAIIGTNLDLRPSGNFSLRAGGTGELFATGPLSLRGALINLN